MPNVALEPTRKNAARFSRRLSFALAGRRLRVCSDGIGMASFAPCNKLGDNITLGRLLTLPGYGTQRGRSAPNAYRAIVRFWSFSGRWKGGGSSGRISSVSVMSMLNRGRSSEIPGAWWEILVSLRDRSGRSRRQRLRSPNSPQRGTYGLHGKTSKAQVGPMML